MPLTIYNQETVETLGDTTRHWIRMNSGGKIFLNGDLRKLLGLREVRRVFFIEDSVGDWYITHGDETGLPVKRNGWLEASWMGYQLRKHIANARLCQVAEANAAVVDPEPLEVPGLPKPAYRIILDMFYEPEE
ncbi:MAG TPA: hypothetical protein DCP28_22365 [Cytophagales bacterium]|nr:hypothetical protein [Cytophagales bacterium]